MNLPAFLAIELPSNAITLMVIGTFITGGLLIFKLIETVGRVMTVRQTEQSRREVAAYVAEGTITPETAERLLRAGRAESWSDRIAELVEAGTIDSSEAAKLIKAGAQAAATPPSGPAIVSTVVGKA